LQQHSHGIGTHLMSRASLSQPDNLGVALLSALQSSCRPSAPAHRQRYPAQGPCGRRAVSMPGKIGVHTTGVVRHQRSKQPAVRLSPWHPCGDGCTQPHSQFMPNTE
jgi:hypothetical protein